MFWEPHYRCARARRTAVPRAPRASRLGHVVARLERRHVQLRYNFETGDYKEVTG